MALAQVSAEALSEAGWPGRDTGTYIGCMFVDYMNLQREGYGLPSTGPVRFPSHHLYLLNECHPGPRVVARPKLRPCNLWLS